MAETSQPLLIKRYASRRLYNTETSDYVTLDDIAAFIRAGRDVQIVDLKSGDDLTRQYLLQIIADHEGRGENVLPLNVLTDLVRSYTTEVQSMVPQFLAQSFDLMRQSQAQMMESLAQSPMAKLTGFEALQAKQAELFKAMTGGLAAWPMPSAAPQPAPESSEEKSDLAEIKKQLAELQSKLSKLR